jgi:hypothetical protein
MRYPATKKYDEKGFAPPLKPGDYMIKISDVRIKDKDGQPYTDKNGYEYCLFEFTVKDYPGNKLFTRFCFDTENPHANINFGIFKQLQIACGVDVETEGDTNDMIGKTCKAYVKVKVYNGNPNNTIAEYKITEEPTDFKSDDDDLPF